MKATGTVLTFVLATLFGAAALAAPQPPSGRDQAGRDLYRELGGDELSRKSLEAVVSMAGREPRVAPYEGIVRAWANSSLASSHFGDDMASYYSKTFTEKELKELLAFLKTPTGKKVVAQMPDAIQHAADLSAVILEANRRSLEETLGKRKVAGAKR